MSAHERKRPEYLERLDAASGVRPRIHEQPIRERLRAIVVIAHHRDADLDQLIVLLPRKTLRAHLERVRRVSVTSAVELRRREVIVQKRDGRIRFQHAPLERLRARDVR